MHAQNEHEDPDSTQTKDYDYGDNHLGEPLHMAQACFRKSTCHTAGNRLLQSRFES